jgi:hypothetical protein
MIVLITATGSYVSSCIRAYPLTVVGTELSSRVVLLVTLYSYFCLVGIPLVMIFPWQPQFSGF